MLSLTVLLTCLVPTGILGLSISEDGHYDTRYNHLDIERILNNKRLVTYYAMCLIGTGPCTPQGTEFKRILPEALRTNCARCTEKQKVVAYLAIRRLKKEYPKIWQQLQAEWDPKGEYVSTFVNTVETSSRQSGVPIPSTTTATINNKFGDGDNEISSSSSSSSQVNVITASTVAPSAPLENNRIVTSSSTTSTTTRRTVATGPAVAPTVAENSQTSPEFNYRTTIRPNRFNILLPRPADFGLRLTANWIGSIGDIGTKVIRTGARIADMVLSSVQATIG